jgi:hypothetical protein
MVQLSQLSAIPLTLMLMRGWDYAVSVRYSGARSKTMIRLLYEHSMMRLFTANPTNYSKWLEDRRTRGKMPHRKLTQR